MDNHNKLFKITERVSYLREYLVEVDSVEEAINAIKESRADLIKEEYEDGDIIEVEELENK